jgi:predicted phage terminase large subunit-like protein
MDHLSEHLQGKRHPVQILTEIAAERMRRDFMLFLRRGWHIIEPKLMQWNWHLGAIAEHLVYLTQGEIRFLMINIPPRMTKSLLCSVAWPVWHWLQRPETQFIGASYDESLALRDAALARRLVESSWYQQHYGGMYYLLPDDNAKKLYRNSKGGYRVTTSVSGKSTGEGGDIQLLDDPHNAQKVESDTVRQTAVSWHDNAWRSRLNDPNNSQKVYIGQRTHDGDIFGHVLAQEGIRWCHLVLPMEHDPKRVCITYANKGEGPDKEQEIFRDPRKKENELLNPGRFNKKTARAEREAMAERSYNAQYQQQPEGAGGLILKRNWWRPWKFPDWHPKANKDRDLPEFMEIIQVYDTAFEEDEEADFTARTTWGVFENRDLFKDPRTGKVKEGKVRVCALLLDRYKERVEFPDLIDEMVESDQKFAPEIILIEKKASGHSAIQTMRRKGLPVKGVKLTDGGDLVNRAHMASYMLKKGCIYYLSRNWSIDVIDECAKFPNGEHDDQVASCVIAWQYMRRYHDLTTEDEAKQDIAPFTWKRATGEDRALRYA